MNEERILDILGILGAVLTTSLGTVFSSLDFTAKLLGIISGLLLTTTAIIHKKIQIENEKLKKKELEEKIKENEGNRETT